MGGHVMEIAPGVVLEPEGWAARLGSALAAARERHAVSLRELAKKSGGRFTARELKKFEQGRAPAGEVTARLLAEIYSIDLAGLTPPRADLEIDLAAGLLSSGGATKRVVEKTGDAAEDLLRSYLDLVWSLRGTGKSMISLRAEDVSVLAEALAVDENAVGAALAELMQCTEEEARRALGALRSRSRVAVPLALVVAVGVSLAATTTYGSDSSERSFGASAGAATGPAITQTIFDSPGASRFDALVGTVEGNRVADGSIAPRSEGGLGDDGIVPDPDASHGGTPGNLESGEVTSVGNEDIPTGEGVDWTGGQVSGGFGPGSMSPDDDLPTPGDSGSTGESASVTAPSEIADGGGVGSNATTGNTPAAEAPGTTGQEPSEGDVDGGMDTGPTGIDNGQSGTDTGPGSSGDAPGDPDPGANGQGGQGPAGDPGSGDTGSGDSGDGPGDSGDAPGDPDPGANGQGGGIDTAPGNSGKAPGNSGKAPGNSGNAPGNSGNAPGDPDPGANGQGGGIDTGPGQGGGGGGSLTPSGPAKKK